MNILYITQFYEPETTAGAFRAADNARFLARQGNHVTVLTTFPNYPTGVVYSGYSVKGLEVCEPECGLRVARSRILIRSNRRYLDRVISQTSFMLFGMRNLQGRLSPPPGGYDVVFASCGPVFAGMLGKWYAKKHDIPFVVEFRDLTWLQMKASGVDGISMGIMRNLELSLTKGAHGVVVATNGLRDNLLDAGIGDVPLSVVKNGAIVRPGHMAPVVKKGKRFQVSYFGTIGLVHDVQSCLPYVEALKGILPDMRCLFVGEGAKKGQLQQDIAAREMSQWAQVVAGRSEEELEAFYEQADLCLVTLKNNSIYKNVLHAKISQIMAHARPILYIGPCGEASHEIEAAGCGLCLTGSGEENLQRLRTFFCASDYPDQLARMGERGYAWAQSHLDREVLAQKLGDVLRQCVCGK